ncbi:MAG TPA: response regulator, partial [Anaerolineae bacterium]|nr:response regulator [Anaerolineae bacterium]
MPYHILIVDDNERSLYMLQMLLQGHNYKVTSAGNGVEALAAARNNPPDMIITDILMPVMDGFALCHQWMDDSQLKDIPFVFYTATYTDSKDENFALTLGATRFIRKPMEPDLLIKEVQKIFKEHRTGQKITSTNSVEKEAIYLKEYNQALVRKLEDKM